jgi:hypothetical protein
MGSNDPAQEYQRLLEVYLHMADDELEQFAEDAASLTDVARQALNAVMGRRKLGPVPEDAPQFEEGHDAPDLVTIRQFGDISEAFLAQGVLESAGIGSFLADGNMASIDWGVTRGMRLQVNADDASAAIAVLEQCAADDSKV